MRGEEITENYLHPYRDSEAFSRLLLQQVPGLDAQSFGQAPDRARLGATLFILQIGDRRSSYAGHTGQLFLRDHGPLACLF
jgi:hypothetical protein